MNYLFSKKSISRVLCLAILLTNCVNTDKTAKNEEFKNSLEIHSGSLDILQVPPVLLRERKIITTREHLVSINIDCDTIFRVFELPDCIYLGGFGSHGKGPGEFSHPNISGFKADNNQIIASDIKSVYAIELPAKGKINNFNVVLRNVYTIPRLLTPLNEAFILNDTIVCGEDGSQKEVVFFDSKNQKIGYLIDLPEIYQDAHEDIKARLFLKFIAISPDKENIAMVYRRFPLLRIYNVKTGSIAERNITEGPQQIDFKLQDNIIINRSESYLYYSRITSNEKYIFARFQAIKNVQTELGPETQDFTERQIHVFNWQGDPILKISLMEDWMNEFAICPKNKFLYLIHPEIENQIYRYNLPNWM